MKLEPLSIDEALKIIDEMRGHAELREEGITGQLGLRALATAIHALSMDVITLTAPLR